MCFTKSNNLNITLVRQKNRQYFHGIQSTKLYGDGILQGHLHKYAGKTKVTLSLSKHHGTLTLPIHWNFTMNNLNQCQHLNQYNNGSDLFKDQSWKLTTSTIYRRIFYNTDGTMWSFKCGVASASIILELNSYIYSY